MNQHIYPLKLSYITKSPLWGGRRLLDAWGIKADSDTVGEAWMLTVRDKDMSVIQNGPLAGMTMRDYIKTYGDGVVGASYDGGEIDIGGGMDNGVELPEITPPGWMNDN